MQEKSNVNELKTESEVYLCSPFFDQRSIDWVASQERFFKTAEIPYFSPREDGINFSTLKGKEREDAITKIFDLNIHGMTISKSLKANLGRVRGVMDIGTLWEIGWYYGKVLDTVLLGPNNEGIEDHLSFTSPDNQDDVKRVTDFLLVLRNLRTEKEYKGRESESILVYSSEDPRVKKSVTLVGGHERCINIKDLLSIGIIDYREFTLLTDDFVPEIMILAGFLFYKDIDYYTISFNNYGSNIMIAESSKGHLQFPGFHSNINNQNLE